MSVQASARVWEHSRSKGSARLVLLALANNADEHGYAWPSVATLATAANISERQARAAIAALEADEELALIAGQGRGHVSVYVVIVGLPPEKRARLAEGLEQKAEEIAAALAARRAKRVQSSQVLAPEKVQTSHPFTAEKVQTSHLSADEKVQSAHIKGANRVRALGAETPKHALIRHEIHEESHESTSTTTTTRTRASEPPQGGGGGAALLAAEGFGQKAIEAFGHYPAELLAADIQRRRALGQGNGAIVNGWKVAPPGAATLPPAPPAGNTAAEQLRQEFAALATQQRHARGKASRPARASPAPPPELRPIWQAALATLQAALPAAEYDTWVRPATLAGLDEDQATVAAPTADHAAALATRYAARLRRALGDVVGRPVQLAIIGP